MLTFLHWIRSIRASNLIFVAFLPFIIYFIATSRNYGKALKSILGIEDNAILFLGAFLFISTIGIIGFIASLKLYKSIRLDVDKSDKKRNHKNACIILAIQAILIFCLLQLPFFEPYIISVAVNSMDARTTDWILMVNQSFVLEPSAQEFIIAFIRKSF